MDEIKRIVRAEVRKYAGSGRGANIRLYPILDDEHATYTVNAIAHPRRDELADVVVLARIVKDIVVIEEDMTNKQLVDALIQAGIKREQICLAYAGDDLPDADYYRLGS